METPKNSLPVEETKKKKDRWPKQYKKQDLLGHGGNAPVFKVQDEKGDYVALKELTNLEPEKEKRFVFEIRTMLEWAPKIDGILPIYKYSEEDWWYTMPIARPLLEYIKETKLGFDDIIKGFIRLAETLKELHQQGISHRDIKPSNLYFYKDRFFLGDFGLVDFPDNDGELTKADHALGAIFTIAPEMKRNPDTADGRMGDVYSLAKTLWMMLTLDEKGFEGRYDFLDKNYCLRNQRALQGVHLVELEDLLRDATSNAPEDRPTMADFEERLKKYLAIKANTEASWRSDWESLQQYFFGKNIPEKATWVGIDAIQNVLNIVGSLPALNHMLLPEGGGIDFLHAEKSGEKGFLTLKASFGSDLLVHPKSLNYVCFPGQDEWDYFFLETEEDQPIFPDGPHPRELLIEDYPGHYVKGGTFVYGVYDYEKGTPLPKGARQVLRYHAGHFLFVLKDGPYNHIGATYDGRQNEMSSEGFQIYSQKLYHLYQKLIQLGCDRDAILRDRAFGANPLSKKHPVKLIKGTKRLPEATLEFIDQHAEDFEFDAIETGNNNEQKEPIAFYLQFNCSLNYDSYLKVPWILGKNKRLQKIELQDIGHSALLLSTREEAIKTVEMADGVVTSFIKNKKMERPKFGGYFSSEIYKRGAPTHLFTENEIHELMAKADDRVENVLVIDGDGSPLIVQDLEFAKMFPVRNEVWDARNNYVGKYSLLDTVPETYLGMLECWYKYLSSGEAQFCDEVEGDMTESTLITLIRKLMKQ